LCLPETILKEFKFNEISVILQHSNLICIKTAYEQLSVSTNEKPVFTNESGEFVIELSGLTTSDAKVDRSWAYAFYEEGGCSKLHYHMEGTENYHVVSGVATVIIDDKEQILKTGEEITIYPGQQHKVISTGKEKLEMIVKCTPAWKASDQYVIDQPLSVVSTNVQI
jgi:mannose-6-phosphate isomerase-like protein (cupin superfamily)